MQVSSAAFRKGTGDFMNWWVGELSALVPKPMQRAFSPVSRTISVVLDGEHISLSRIENGTSDPIGQFAVDGQAMGAASSDIKHVLAQFPSDKWRWGLYLGSDVALGDRLHLPVAARENFFEAVEFQIDRQTPFQPGDVYFDCRPSEEEINNGMFGVDFVVAPRSGVDSVLRRLTLIGIPIDFVTVESDIAGAKLPFDLLPDHAPANRHRGRGINAFLMVFALLLGGSAILLSLDHDRRHAEALAGQVEQMRKEARVASGLKDEISAEDRNVNSVLDLKRDQGSISQVLNDLSALLPDDTWVSRFSYKGGDTKIVVHAPESASVVGLIEGSNQFVGAKMMTAVRRLKNQNRERFTLGFSNKKRGQP